MIGTKVGKLIVLRKNEDRKYHYWCECECGNIVSILQSRLKKQKLSACGKCKTYFIQPGDKYNDLEVLQQTSIPRNKWDCKCICGKIINCVGSAIINGRTKRCVECNNRDKYIGTKYGSLTITGKAERKGKKFKRQYYYYKCDCGKTGEIIYSGIGKSKSCGCKHSDYAFHEEMSAAFFNRIPRGAKERGLEFSVTKDYCWKLFLEQHRKCAITHLDISFGRNRETTTASLDRKDSTIGYIEENVQWVHKKINMMKWKIHDTTFKEWFDEAAECYIAHKREQESLNDKLDSGL